jgi:23S rRNA pseudouridine2457 synthase
MHRHFILHKPYGYLSQFVYQLKRPKKLLGELYDFPVGTMAIGRLDEDSEGLLLLTTDGKVSDWVCSSKVEETIDMVPLLGCRLRSPKANFAKSEK